MAKGSRFLEGLIHDIPIYPFSSTPDGRIVAELHRGRKNAQEFHEEVMGILERGQREIANIHGGALTVSADQFNAHETQRVLQDVFYEMQHASYAQEQNAQALDALGQATEEGFTQLHSDLQDVKGPNYPHENLDDLIEKDGDFFASMCAYTKGYLSRNAIGEFHEIFRRKMAPLQNAVPTIEASIEGKIQEEQQRQLEQLQRMQQQNPRSQQSALLPPLKTLRDFPELQAALNFFKNPLALLTDDRGKVWKVLAVLLSAAEHYDEPVLKKIVEHVNRFFESYRRAQQTPVSQEMLIKLGQNHLLNSGAQHQVMKYFPETRDDASLTTINYSLLDIARDTRTAIQQRNILAATGVASLKLQHGMLEQGETAIDQRATLIEQGSVAQKQRDRGLAHLGNMVNQGETRIQQGRVANYHLASIVDNLAVVHGDMVDLGKIVEDFAGLVEEGFDHVNATFERGFEEIDERLVAIQTEMVLTRTAVVAELKTIDESILYVGRGIINSIERTNEILGELVQIARESHQLAHESHTNEARQYFEDGTGCLKAAEVLEDIETAYKQFCKGIEAHEMTIENHYGAGLCAELLGRLAEAKRRYERVINRCKKEQEELKSQAQEGLGRTECKLGNLPEAVKQSKEATDTDPKNYSARYNQAKYLALQGFMDETVNILSALIQEKPEWYLKIKADEILGQIPQQYLSKLYKNLATDEKGTTIRAKAQILEDVLLLEERDLAISIIMDLLEIMPVELIRKQIWHHPGFKDIQPDLQKLINQHLSKNLGMLSAKACYELTILLHCLGCDSETILRIFQEGIEQDPGMYKKNVDRKAILIQQLASVNAIKAGELDWIFSKINLPNL